MSKSNKAWVEVKLPTGHVEHRLAWGVAFSLYVHQWEKRPDGRYERMDKAEPSACVHIPQVGGNTFFETSFPTAEEAKVFAEEKALELCRSVCKDLDPRKEGHDFSKEGA